jgi:thiamine biosynthesis protein ThiS
MNLTVNGEDRSFGALASLSDLVAELGLDARKVAVEHNLEIVPRSAYGRTALSRRRPDRDRAFYRRRLTMDGNPQLKTPGRWPAAPSPRA